MGKTLWGLSTKHKQKGTAEVKLNQMAEGVRLSLGGRHNHLTIRLVS